jgi:serine/threonine-protein kinase ATR
MWEAVADNWLEWSITMRQIRRFDSSKVSLRNAELYGLNKEVVLINECRLLKESGQLKRALPLLEPVEPNIQILQNIISEKKQNDKTISDQNKGKLGKGNPNHNPNPKGGYPEGLETSEKRKNYAERLFLATQCMAEGKQRNAKCITARYQCAVALDSNETAHFEFGRYLERLYHDTKGEEDLNSGGGKMAKSKKKGNYEEQEMEGVKSLTYIYLKDSITQYTKSIGKSGHYSLQAVPRLLTLWLTFTATTDSKGMKRSSSTSSQNIGSSTQLQKRASVSSSPSPLAEAQENLNLHMSKVINYLQPAQWYEFMPQLTSRTGHCHLGTLKLIIGILKSIMVAYPRQGIWHISGLIHSLNKDRRKIGIDLINDTVQKLQALGQKEEANMIADSHKFFPELIELAGMQGKEKKMRWKLQNKVELQRFLVPTQAALHVRSSLPTRLINSIPTPLYSNNSQTKSSISSGNSSGLNTNSTYVPDTSYDGGIPSEMHFSKIHEVVDVAGSKARPKTITVVTTCGQVIRFLCKQEKDGDLRKDARMMEVNTALNRILLEDPEGRRRNLRIRTYSVTCLNEECGLLEWVENTQCVRHLISDSHELGGPILYPLVNHQIITKPFHSMQTSLAHDLMAMKLDYQKMITNNYRPCLHLWFLENFPDPTEWLEARTKFTRSTAVWSSVGYIVGLGDRHIENVMIDTTNGENINCDFDCLFDKGLSLAKPEIVPFRLTPNMVDAMGLTGFEGSFRRTMEVCMSLLRQNKDTLLGILEPFIRDPTVSWGRTGRAQRQEHGKTNVGVIQDNDNTDAKEALLKITERLDGIYNLAHPQGRLLFIN